MLRSLLNAFAGLEVMELLPDDGDLEAFTASNAGTVIASLDSWAAAHPTRAFEARLMVPPLRELARALGHVAP